MTPLIFAMSLLVTDAGPAEATAPLPPHAKGEKNPDIDDPDRVICKNQAITGSRFIKRICMTRADWNEQTRKTQEAERKLGESAGFSAASATGGGMSGSGH
jgi:hypothetical protein